MAYRSYALDVEKQAERYVTGHREPTVTMALRALLRAIHRRWSHMIYVMCCVFAVSLDPLFFYVLIIDQDNKCLQMDKKLSTIALVLRSLTDIIFVVRFIYKNVGVKVKNMSWLSFSIINDFLALLPVPQLLIVFTFYHIRGDKYVENRKILNVFILGQYLPRIYRVHQSSNILRNTAGIWVQGLFNFVLYILASHILGALWYFFSIQQETLCWYGACAKHSLDRTGCMNTFYCGRQTTTSRNITFLNEYCSLDTSDGALHPFNFGIFLDSIKNHNPEHIKFEKKLFYSFWWGLRNLSNFGTNLITSMYVLENLFAILISLLGLLLFLYLIGNVQTLIQIEATKKEEMRQRVKGGETYRKVEYVSNWIFENNFPDNIRKDIWNGVNKALEKDKYADVEDPFLVLPLHAKESVKRYLFMDKLRTVNELKDKNDYVLKSICHYLKPVTYIANNLVFRMGDPLNCMLFIMEGTMWTYASSDSNAGQGISSMPIKFKPLQKGDFYGEELLKCASERFTEVPVSSKHVKSLTKVKAFVLMVEDLETIVSAFTEEWGLDNHNNHE